MEFVIVSNRRSRLKELHESVNRIISDCRVTEFLDPMMSAKYIFNNQVDFVFAEAKMRPVDGVSLLKVIRIQKPYLPVVIVSDTDDFRECAMSTLADDYLVIPETLDDKMIRDVVAERGL